MAGTGQPNYGGSRTVSNASISQGSSFGNALVSSSAGTKGCINTDKIIDSGSLQLTGIQTVTGNSATVLNTTTIISVTAAPTGAVTLTADTGGAVLGRILIIKNASSYTVTLGGATAATTKTTLCYYTGSAWANLLTGGY